MSQYYDKASLVVLPSGYKAGTVYAQKPLTTDGQLAFTRTGDTATRVNSAGIIEKVRTNLVLQSQTFDNASWTKSSATITANTTAAPDGTTTADTLVITTGGYLLQSFASFSAVTGSRVAISIYAKNQTNGFLLFGGATPAGTDVYSIQDVGNGWYRHSVLRTFTTTTTGTVQYIINTVGTHIIWGAQFENDIATVYIPTTTAAVSVGPVANVPRLDYLGSTCPRLLLEPQRTNGHTFSEQLNNAAWSKLNSTVTANSAISPDGYQNADKLVDNSTSGTHVAFQVYAFTSAVSHTISVFAKAAEITSINIFNNAAVGFDATFNLTNGTVTSVASGGTATINAYGNGWYRCAVTATAAVTSANTQFRLVKSGNTSYVGNGTDGLLLWGAQVEQGFLTSYIPTLAASATRGADACSKTGISSLIGQTEGTIFVDCNLSAITQERRLITISDGTESQRLFIWTLSNLLYFTSNAQSISLGAPPLGTAKIAVGYTISGGATTYSIKVNNNTLITGTLAAAPTPLNVIHVGSNTASGTILSDRVNQTLLFKTRLTNAELAELTTL